MQAYLTCKQIISKLKTMSAFNEDIKKMCQNPKLISHSSSEMKQLTSFALNNKLRFISYKWTQQLKDKKYFCFYFVTKNFIQAPQLSFDVSLSLLIKMLIKTKIHTFSTPKMDSSILSLQLECMKRNCLIKIYHTSLKLFMIVKSKDFSI